MKGKDGLQIRGTVQIIVRGPNGRIKEHHTHRNLIVDKGFDNVNSLLRGTGGSALTHIGIGWEEPDNPPIPDPAAGDINLPTGGNYKQDRVAAVLSKIDDKNFKLVASWGSGEPASAGSFPVPIRSIGAFWDGGTEDNEIFSWIKRAVINKASVDTFEFTYTFTMS